MKRIIKIVVLIFVLLVITGCEKTEIEVNNSTENKPVMYERNIPKHINKRLGKGFVVDADVLTPWSELPNKMGTLKVQRPNFNAEKVKNMFLPTAIEDKKYSKVYKDESGNNYYDKIYNSKDENYLVISNSNISLESPLYKYVEHCVYDVIGYDNYNLDHYKAYDLTFMPKDTVTDKVINVMNSLGIKVYNKYDVHSLDHKIMKEEEVLPEDITGKKSEKKKSNWTADDDCYYFNFYQKMNGIPISDSFFGSYTKKNITHGPTIRCIYGKDGWVKVNISNIYKLKSKNNDESNIIDLNKALEKIKSTYATVPNGGNGLDYTEINKINFCYIPKLKSKSSQDIELIPAWSFSFLVKYKNDPNESFINKPFFINAINGEIII